MTKVNISHAMRRSLMESEAHWKRALITPLLTLPPGSGILCRDCLYGVNVVWSSNLARESSRRCDYRLNLGGEPRLVLHCAGNEVCWRYVPVKKLE